MPRSVPELEAVAEDDLPTTLFQLLVTASESRRPDRRGRASLSDAIYPLGVSFDAISQPLRGRLCDAFHELCERGFLWFNPHAEGFPGGHCEFTKRGRSATVSDVESPWFSSAAAVLERFPQHAQWDETMAAYFRMAVATHAARVYEPALFLIGGAAERLVAVVEERVANLLRVSSQRKDLRERLVALAKLFREAGDVPTAELIEVLGHTARWSRNDIGHPKPKPPDVGRAMVAARICEFPGYVERVLYAAEGLISSGRGPIR